ncbi:hypothetical protein [Streptomyces sp. NPDC047108]|uniref:DUF6924 domain-containing protein n=1 Tax=Streptomyces sp. NPDC047108 TaxID=3155025 RepID=UPI00340BBDE4
MTRPEVVGRGESVALVVRTDYSDEPTWQAVKEDMARPWGEEAEFHFVDDGAWSGATPDEVLAAVAQDENLAVVFVADSVTMQAPHHALLALDTVGEDDIWEPEGEEESGPPPPREFRTAPAGAHDVHVNLDIANMDFFEFADAAALTPQGIYEWSE